MTCDIATPPWSRGGHNSSVITGYPQGSGGTGRYPKARVYPAQTAFLATSRYEPKLAFGCS